MTRTPAIRQIDVDGQSLRVATTPGDGPPLLLFNGIGANLEMLQPLIAALDGIATIAFDVPGTGGSPHRLAPYRMSGLARMADRLLHRLGHGGEVDVLGLSWGGTLAQQFAFSRRGRCRRLVLAATTPGVLMVPGSPFPLLRLLHPRRHGDPSHLERVAPQIYGGATRRDPRIVREHGARSRPPHRLGYLYQQLALTGWSSLAWLPLLPQPTLVLAGNDDPLIPVVNARILAALIPRARLEIVDDGHLFLLTDPHRFAPSIREFLAEEGARARGAASRAAAASRA